MQPHRVEIGPPSGPPKATRSDARVQHWAIGLTALVAMVWAASAVMGFIAGLMILTGLGFVLACLGLWRPELGLFGVGMLCALDAPMRRYIMTGDPLPWNTLNYFLLIVMVLRARDLIRFLSAPQIRIVIAFLCVLLAGLASSADREEGELHILGIATLFGLLAYFERGASSRTTLLWLAILVGTLAALGAPIFYLQEDLLPVLNPNAWSYFPLTGLFVAALAAAFAPRKSPLSWILLVLAGFNGVWVFLSGSRGSSIVALLCGFFIIRQLGVSGRSLGVAAIVLACGLVVASPFLTRGSFTLEKVGKMFDSERSLTNRTSGRSDLALGGWYIFLDHPMGIGTGGFAPAWSRLGQRRGLSTFHMDTEFPAHSAWIKVLAENGLPGILLLAAFAASFAVFGLRSGNARAAELGILTTAVLVVAFVSTEFQPKGLWLLSAGSTFLLSRVPRRGRQRSREGADRRLLVRDSAA